jgi:methyltransferase (TIGR00027 family)
MIRNVTGTAFVVAEFRAEENDAADPLYRDPIVNLFLDEASRQAAARIASGYPQMGEMVKIRTRYFDDVLERRLAAGCRQVVVLGAGLDTRALRKPAAGVTYFEIDDAATLALKRGCLEQHGIQANARFIAGNYVTDGMIPLLIRNGFDPDLPTYVIWEGNTMYLPLDTDRVILDQLRDTLADFHVSFDYLAKAVITKTTGEVGLTRMAERFAAMGAPWITGFDDIRVLAKAVKLRVVDDVTTGDLYRVYRPLASERPIFGPFYSVCTLASG